MLYMNQQELSKNIASLIDEAIKFEVFARDEEIKKLKEKLIWFAKVEKEHKEIIKQNIQLKNQLEWFTEMLNWMNSGEILSVHNTSWQDWNEYGDCWWEYKYTAKMKDWTEKDFILWQ